MAAAIKTLTERARQNLRVGDRRFQPTPNQRNHRMLEEADAFATYMRKFEKSLSTYEGQISALLRNYPLVLRGNLPRVWELVEGGMVEPVRQTVSHEHPSIVGGDCDEQVLRDIQEAFTRRLQNEIIRPIKRWCDTLVVIKERMAIVEKFRLELDARRRRLEPTFEKARHRLERANREATVTSSESESDEEERERAREDFGRAAVHKQRKLQAIERSYRDSEQLVWEQLSGLVRDAAWLKSYVVGSFLVIKETLQASILALGPTKQPLPGFAHRGASTEYGQIGDNAAIAAAMPQDLGEERAIPTGALVEGLSEQAAGRHPSRQTAQPLQAAADPRSRGEAVPLVIRSQADVPVAPATPSVPPPSTNAAGRVRSPEQEAALLEGNNGTGAGGILGAGGAGLGAPAFKQAASPIKTGGGIAPRIRDSAATFEVPPRTGEPAGLVDRLKEQAVPGSAYSTPRSGSTRSYGVS